MGVDWRDLTFGSYMAILSEWNRRHDPNPRDPIDADRLQRAIEAHS